MAAYNGKTYMVMLLLEKGADINIRDKVSQNISIMIEIGSKNDIRIIMIIVQY